MTSVLHVQLPAGRLSTGTELRYILTSDGAAAPRQGIAVPATMPRATSTVVLVPPTVLSWHTVKVPPVPGARLRATLDGLLEERLLDDTAACAMAVAPWLHPDGSRTVAVFERVWLTDAIAMLEQAGQTVARVVPEWQPATPDAGQDATQRRAVVFGQPDDVRCVLIDQHAVVQLPVAGTQLAHTLRDMDASGLSVQGELAVLPWLHGHIPQASAGQDAVRRIIEAARSGLELAQFDLAISRRGRLLRQSMGVWRGFWRLPAWRPLRWGLAMLVAANLIGLNAWAWRLQETAIAKRGQINSTFAEAFPRVKTIVDAPLQMRREVALMRRSSGGLVSSDLEVILSALGQALPPGAAATAIDYGAGELTVSGLALQPDAAGGLVTRLALAGYKGRLDGERIRVAVDGRP